MIYILFTAFDKHFIFILIECLKTNPDERPNIDQVIENKWIAVSLRINKSLPQNNPFYQQYEVVPATPLVTSEVLREETDLWMDVKQGMSLALQEMRIDKVRHFPMKAM